jgi:hypothetical protein
VRSVARALIAFDRDVDLRLKYEALVQQVKNETNSAQCLSCGELICMDTKTWRRARVVCRGCDVVVFCNRAFCRVPMPLAPGAVACAACQLPATCGRGLEECSGLTVSCSACNADVCSTCYWHCTESYCQWLLCFNCCDGDKPMCRSGHPMTTKGV